MANVGNVVFWISLAGLFVLSVLSFARARNARQFLFYLAVLAACGGIYLVVFQSGPHLQPKGKQPHESIFLIILYGCMLVGIACHYFYSLFMKPQRVRPPFDVGSFLAPIFASPIVFRIPTLILRISHYLSS